MNQLIKNNDSKDNTLFEYPLKESFRSYLRLESLFKQFQQNLQGDRQYDHFNALQNLFEILDILERGDTRPELIKELSRLLGLYRTMDKNPDVDTSKLTDFLQKLNRLHQWIHNYQGKFGQSIRTQPFIEAVKYRIGLPGGSSPIDCPELHYFLSKPKNKRQESLNTWINDIKGVETSIEVILRLARENAQWQFQKAPLGSFMLETNEKDMKLLRIKLKTTEYLFPEISCGKQRSSIHFMTFNSADKKIPLNAEVEFELACCF